jgi:hypothetical protein
VPVDQSELESRGIWDFDRLTTPYIRAHHLTEMFGHDKVRCHIHRCEYTYNSHNHKREVRFGLTLAQVSEIVRRFFDEPVQWHYQFKPEYNTEKKLEVRCFGHPRLPLYSHSSDFLSLSLSDVTQEALPEGQGDNDVIRPKLFALLRNVILLRDDTDDRKFHFRILMHQAPLSSSVACNSLETDNVCVRARVE